MKTILSRATAVAVALAISFVTLQVHAQQTAPRPSGTSVAVIDLNMVFKKHPRLTAELESIKSQITSYETFMRQEQQKVQSLAAQLKTLKPGTPDYAGREKEYAGLQADLGVQVRQKQREFLEREAQVRYQAYVEIQQQVSEFCKLYGIQLVIRFSADPIDATKPQEVMMGLNRPIVFQNSLDITNHIIAALETAAPAPPAPGGSTAQRPATGGTHVPLRRQ